MTTKTRPPRSGKNTRLKKRMTAALEQLAAVDLIKPTGDHAGEASYSFKHALVQDTAHATLLHGEYKRLHLLVAQAYEQVYADRGTDEFAAVLAQHYSAGGDDLKTIEYATQAGDAAAHVYANAEAVTYYTMALKAAMALDDNATITQLYLKRGRAHELMSKHDLALENYAEMEKVAQARGDRHMELAASMACTTIHSTPNPKFDAVVGKARSAGALALARELNDRASEAKILWNMMLLAHFQADNPGSISFGEQSIAIARELGLTEQLAYSLNDISRPYMMGTRYADSLAASYEAYELWQALDNKPMLADNLNTRATILFNLGEYDRVVAFASEAYDLCKLINNSWGQPHSMMTLSFVYAERGEVSKSIETMIACMDRARQVGFLIAIASVQGALAIVYGELGDTARGLEILNTPQLPAASLNRWENASLAIAARLYLMAGDVAQARSLLQASYATGNTESLSPFQIGTAFFADAELALAEENYERALAKLDDLLRVTGERGLRFYRQPALYLKGRALFGLGRTDEALEILQLARSEEERSGARRTLWRILALLGEIEHSRGSETAAQELRTQAGSVLQFIIEHTPDEYIEPFTQQPDVCAVIE